MSGVTSQPSMGAFLAGIQGTPLESSIRLDQIQALNTYWEQMRLLYSCFDPGLKSGDSSVYEHEMPGGQYTNLLFQSQSLGLGSQWGGTFLSPFLCNDVYDLFLKWLEIKKAYAAANRLCGDIVKVTPSSKVVGDLAQFMVRDFLRFERC